MTRKGDDGGYQKMVGLSRVVDRKEGHGALVMGHEKDLHYAP